MFRKDPGRSGASTDRITLPATKVWSWKSQRIAGYAVLSTVVVRGDYAYFTSGPRVGVPNKSKGRLLVCVDARTGKLQWARQLDTARLHAVLPEDIGPAVSEQGTIFAIDLTMINRPCPQPTFMVKAFGVDGTLLDARVIPVRNEMSRMFLREGVGLANYVLTPKTKPPT
ncbi:MAG TPA: hypothetical protein VG820_02310 [Fimbriimonadaceae bacterium]|nr:hypothetical protein [Fimbriimonadaceae bacterium]